MLHGWADLIKRHMIRSHEFVSADAKRLSNDPRTYEMLSSKSPESNLKSPDAVVMSPLSTRNAPFSSAAEAKSDYFGLEIKPYVSPISSFSAPKPPGAYQGREGMGSQIDLRQRSAYFGHWV